MFNFLFSKKTPRNHAGDTRIRHITGKGYTAEVFVDDFLDGPGWHIIETSGNECHTQAIALSSNHPEYYFSETEEEAGQIVNAYHQLYFNTHDVVWESRPETKEAT